MNHRYTFYRGLILNAEEVWMMWVIIIVSLDDDCSANGKCAEGLLANAKLLARNIKINGRHVVCYQRTHSGYTHRLRQT